jgi:purine-cytosine permease-like protein
MSDALHPHEQVAHHDDLGFEMGHVGEAIKHDYATDASGGIVPLNRRRGLVSLGALWLTMNCGFGEIFLGYEYHSAGFTLLKALAVSVIGCALYLVYAVPSAYLGSRTGQTHALLSRSIFAGVGSVVVAIALLIEGTGFVGFQAGITAQIYQGLYGWNNITLVACIAAAVMIFNNLFGFTGVVAWARYVVTPVIILWIGYLLIKAFFTEPSSVMSAHPKTTAAITVWAAIGAMIGVIAWGDEPDFWRYGKPSFWWSLPGYLFGLIVGDIFFTIGGWMMAELSTGSSYANSVTFVTHYSLFGAFWLAFIVASVSQAAAQDGNYYVAINALQNVFGSFRGWNRLYSCGLAVIGGVFATWALQQGTQAWLYFITFSSAAVPAATTVMMVDHFVVPRLFSISRPLTKVPSWSQTGVANVPAIVALVPSVIIGTFGAGAVPWTSDWYWYLPGPLSWVSAGIVYLIGVALVARRSDAFTWLGFSRLWDGSPLRRTRRSISLGEGDAPQPAEAL